MQGKYYTSYSSGILPAFSFTISRLLFQLSCLSVFICVHVDTVCRDCIGTTTGPTCVRTCEGIPNGNYQSCLGCDVFINCKRGYMKDSIPCPPENGTKTYWNDILRVCTTEESKTCILHNVGDRRNHNSKSLCIFLCINADIANLIFSCSF